MGKGMSLAVIWERVSGVSTRMVPVEVRSGPIQDMWRNAIEFASVFSNILLFSRRNTMITWKIGVFLEIMLDF